MSFSRAFLGLLVFEKVLVALWKYCIKLFILLISLYISGCLIFMLEHGFEEFQSQNLINRPEAILKFFWNYVKFWKNNRNLFSFYKNAQLLFLLALPYAFFKILKLIIGFLLFKFALKSRTTFPAISQFFLNSKFLNSYIVNIAANQKSPASLSAKSTLAPNDKENQNAFAEMMKRNNKEFADKQSQQPENNMRK